MSFCCYLTPSPLSSPLSHSHAASEIFNSLESFPTDTTVINEIFCLLPHQELALAAETFSRRFGANLKDRLQAKLAGTKNHLQLSIKILQNGRSEDQTVDEAMATEQARALNGILGKVTILGNLNDEATTELIDFVLTLSYSQAQAVKVSSYSINSSVVNRLLERI
jgi:hypothetical protein